MSSDYVPVRIGTLRPDDPFSFDVYIQVADRYLKYVLRNDSLTDDRIGQLKKKGVKKLYITPDAEDSYLVYLDKGLDEALEKDKPIEQRGANVQNTMTQAAEQVEKNLETEAGAKRTQKQIQKLTQFLVSDKTALASVLSASGTSRDEFQHGSNVASLTLSVAAKMEIEDPGNLFALGVAALAHDIGKSLAGEPKEHPARGAHVLGSKKFVTAQILRLINDHHEIGEGKGYPERKNLANMELDSQIMNMCNNYDRFTIDQSLASQSGFEAWNKERASLFDEDLVAALQEAIAGK